MLQVTHDLVSGYRELAIDEDDGRFRIEPSGVEYEEAATERFGLSPDDPLSARVECRRTVQLLLPFPDQDGEEEEGPAAAAPVRVRVEVEACMSTAPPDQQDCPHATVFQLRHRLKAIITPADQQGRGGGQQQEEEEEEEVVWEQEWCSDRVAPPPSS